MAATLTYIGFAPGDPVFVIPDAAPHSDRLLRTRTYTEVLGGEEMNPVIGSIPGEFHRRRTKLMAAAAPALQDPGRRPRRRRARARSPPPSPPTSASTRPHRLLGSGRQALRLLASRSIFDLRGTPAKTAFAYITNFEEIGSVNNTGAGSQFLDSASPRSSTPNRRRTRAALAVRNALRDAAVLSPTATTASIRSFP